MSIIVPVYNAAKYLHACVDSVLNQSFSDYEILLVDDGSSDDSYAIACQYAEQDERIRAFTKKNEGVSSTRNYGIEKSRGEFLFFLDSDDRLPDDALSLLCDKMAYDYVAGEIAYIDDALPTEHCASAELHDAQIGEYLTENLPSFVFRSACASLFRREIIVRNQLRFNSRMRLGEDTCFVQQFIKHCKDIRIVDKPTYLYRHTQFNPQKYPHSISQALYSIDAMMGSYDSLCKAHRFTCPLFIHTIRLYVICFNEYCLQNGYKREDVASLLSNAHYRMLLNARQGFSRYNKLLQRLLGLSTRVAITYCKWNKKLIV